MKILVTGAAGFIGSHLTDTLLKAGHHVTGFDNLINGKLGNLKNAERNENVFNDVQNLQYLKIDIFHNFNFIRIKK